MQRIFEIMEKNFESDGSTEQWMSIIADCGGDSNRTLHGFDQVRVENDN